MTSTAPHERRSLSSGYLTLDVVLYGRAVGHAAGGTAGNVAANLAYLGWRSQITALVGTDPAGRQLRDDLRRSGVDVRHLIARDDVSTPRIVHEVLDGRHRFRFSCPTCGEGFPRLRPPSRADMAPALDPAPDLFFFDRVNPATVWAAEASRDAGGLVVFEPSAPGRAELFDRAMTAAHLVKYNVERVVAFADQLASRSARQVHIRTSGEAGAAWRIGRNGWTTSAGFPLESVDAGGAGDWMTAGFLSALPTISPDEFIDVDLSWPVKFGQAIAALSCRFVGARGMGRALPATSAQHRAFCLIADLYSTVPKQTSTTRQSRRTARCRACLASAR